MPDWFLQALGYATIYAVVIKAVLAATPTPPTDRWCGKVYRALEWSVLVIGRVKEGASR